MNTKIEGILLSKIDHKERNVLGNVLLRNGKKVGLYFYGGKSGGKKPKSTGLEIGNMLKIEVSKSNNKVSDIYNSKEWGTLWTHQKIRYDHNAFYLLCFFIEVINKLATSDDLRNDHFDETTEGLFRVLSNSVFYLEKSLEENAFNASTHLFTFLGKVLQEQGVFPDLESCALSAHKIVTNADVFLAPNHGGFVLRDSINIDEQRQHSFDVGRRIYHNLKDINFKKTSELIGKNEDHRELVKPLFHYFCYQFQFNESDFKSLGLIL